MRGPFAHRPPFTACLPHRLVALRLVRALLCGLLWLLCVGMPQRARAWTDATVRSGRAEVELTADGAARVQLWIQVRVDGGWLEGLELEGLDDDATLDPERPITFRDVNGVALPVQVTPREHGRVSLRFARRSAPRRGEYDITAAWITTLEGSRALDADTVEARWTFPAWRFGLDGVDIRWVVPAGSTAQPADEITAPIETVVEPLGDGTGRLAIVYHRAHLPRTSDWESLVRVPVQGWPHVTVTQELAESDEGARTAASGMRATTVADASSANTLSEGHTWLGLSLLLVVGAWIKRRDLDARAARARKAAPWLIALPRWLHASVCVVAAFASGLAVWLGAGPLPAIGAGALLVLLGWQRGSAQGARPRVLSLSAVSSAEIARVRRAKVLEWIAPSAWLEPSRWGLVTAAAVLVVAVPIDAPSRVLAALFVALVVSGTRRTLGVLPGEDLRRLAAAMERFRATLGAPFVAMRLLGRGTRDPFDVRLHLSFAAEGPAARVLEQLRAELVIDEDALALRIAAREHSGADVALRAWAESAGVAVHDISRRRAVLVPIEAGQVGAQTEAVLAGILALAPREQDATLREELAAEGGLIDAALLDAAE